MRLLNIQFLATNSTAIITLAKFLKSNSVIPVIDPYSMTMFGGNGCIGNIDYEKLGREEPYLDMLDGVIAYWTWDEIMRRCFDSTYSLYSMYGGRGTAPYDSSWRCFRYFYKAIDIVRHQVPLLLDPNCVEYYARPNLYRVL